MIIKNDMALQIPTCVLLDLETTGVDPTWDSIIEVAIVKFDGEKVIDTYQTFINPEIKIPEFITALTSITDSDVQDAPRIDEVIDDIREFIGDSHIVGQNIDFDIKFLKNNDLDLTKHTAWDTYDLAGMALPGIASYSLASLSDILDVETKPTHRAIDDCRANADVFVKICELLTVNTSKEMMEEITKQAQKANWDAAQLFELLVPQCTNTDSEEIVLNFDTQTAESKKLDFKQKDIEKIFEKNGILNEVVSTYEPRESQQEMVTEITETLEEKADCCIEAATGTGKTLAYLIPTTIKALSEKSKVVVSTATLNLQSQLIEKDIPTLKKVIESYSGGDVQVSATTLKGKNNYLCLERLDALKQKTKLDKTEARLLIKLMIWAKQTKTGDKSEITLQRGEHGYWKEVNCESLNCANHSAKRCYLNKARTEAQTADIIIANHSLLLADANSDGGIMPTYKYLVIDEAHHLETIATKQFSSEINHEFFQSTISSGLEEMRAAFPKDKKPLIENTGLVDKCNTVADKIESAQGKIDIMYGLVGRCIDAIKKKGRTSSDNVMINEFIINYQEYQELKSSTENTITAINEIQTGLLKISDMIEEESSDKIDAFKEIIISLHSNLERFTATATHCIIEREENDIAWINYKYKQDTTQINTAPLNVSSMINETVFDDKQSIIITSATMTIDNSFDYIKKEIGLDQFWKTKQINSGFDYENNCHVIIPNDIPVPTSPDFSEKVHKVIIDAARETEGKTLALFTSNKAVENAYKEIKIPLKNMGIEVLAQHITGTRERIISLYKKNPEKYIILGSSSFWEGVDLPHDYLKTVVITKLPFDLPDDPIFVARSKQYNNAFMEYSVPRSVLKFKQGFGRLIRTGNDTGNVIMTDTRLIHKEYGKVFTESLPTQKIISVKHSQIADVMYKNDK